MMAKDRVGDLLTKEGWRYQNLEQIPHEGLKREGSWFKPGDSDVEFHPSGILGKLCMFFKLPSTCLFVTTAYRS